MVIVMRVAISDMDDRRIELGISFKRTLEEWRRRERLRLEVKGCRCVNHFDSERLAGFPALPGSALRVLVR